VGYFIVRYVKSEELRTVFEEILANERYFVVSNTHHTDRLWRNELKTLKFVAFEIKFHHSYLLK